MIVLGATLALSSGASLAAVVEAPRPRLPHAAATAPSYRLVHDNHDQGIPSRERVPASGRAPKPTSRVCVYVDAESSFYNTLICHEVPRARTGTTR